MSSLDERELAPIAPELFVPDVAETVRFYRERLGFRLLLAAPANELTPETDFAVIALDGATLLIAHESLYGIAPETLGRRGVGIDIRVMVDDVGDMDRRCRENGVTIIHDIDDRDYGLRDFIVTDLNGFRLRFASPLR